jgi:S1-C subfamily serine protease
MAGGIFWTTYYFMGREVPINTFKEKNMRKTIASIFTALMFLATPVFLQAQDKPSDADLKKQIEALQTQLDDHKEKDSIPGADVPQHLQDISVTILSKSRMGSGEGSGVIMTRKFPNGESVNFIWTAAHVVDNLRKTRSIIDPKTGTPKTVVEFDDAMIVKGLTEDGRNVGKMELFAEVIRYSAEEDLALLRLRKKNFVSATVEFHLGDEIPKISTPLLHVGSLLGQLGSNSMTTGIMSQHGRLINKKVFDQTTVAAFPGSSGGGVYLKDGKMVGMLVRGAGETFNLIVPVRRMQTWAKSAHIEWALDHKVPMITEEDLSKLPVEDTGVTFSYSRKAEAADGAAAAPHSFRSVITGTGPMYLGSRKAEMQWSTYHIWRPTEKPVQIKKSE